MRVLALLLLAALSLNCVAAPFAVRLGTERVALDTPPGFADSLELASPRLQEAAEALTSASNRILVFALTDADLRSFTRGDSPEMRRYLLVATPRAMQGDRLGAGEFRAYVADALRGLGNPAEPADIRKHLDAMAPGQAGLLWELRRTPEAVSVLQGTRVPTRSNAPAQYLLASTTYLLARGKVLVVSAFAGYQDETDPDWLRGVTARWIDELLRLNAR